MEARTKRTDAAISCAPLDPCQRKCGERIHRNSGIIMIRVIVMELGRFIEPRPRSRVSGGDASLSHWLGSCVSYTHVGKVTFMLCEPHFREKKRRDGSNSLLAF